MKKTTIGIFADRGDAEKFINYAHNELKLPHEDISYIYKDIFGNKKEVQRMHHSSDAIWARGRASSKAHFWNYHATSPTPVGYRTWSLGW